MRGAGLGAAARGNGGQWWTRYVVRKDVYVWFVAGEPST